ncbi:MAG: type II secretion system protein [Candidatus Omnitrophica bacterium]|nr:type II secretion system protein [Candidatus Omnitrophota bacterium]
MKKGFTIIELIIVLSVLVILIGIIVPRMSGMQQQGNVVKAKAELQTLQTAMESYYMNNGNTYPGTPQQWNYTPSETYFTQATPQIVSSVLYDPFNPGNEYGMYVSQNGKYYAFASYGPGGTSFCTTGPDLVSNTGSIDKNGCTHMICVTNGTGC